MARTDIKISGGNLCAMYAPAGWGKTVRLALGQGSSHYMEWIKLAVNLWNGAAAFTQGWKGPLIEIDYERPENYRADRSVFTGDLEAAREVRDGQNVIYFMPNYSQRTHHGLAWRWEDPGSPGQIGESDVFINTWAEETYGRNSLSITSLLSDWDGIYGMYARIDASFAIILHELGHVVGLNHIPTKGNIMSRDYMPRVVDQWAVVAALYKLTSPEVEPEDLAFMYPHRYVQPYEALHPQAERARREQKVFTEHARLGGVEKMLLSCLYEY